MFRGVILFFISILISIGYGIGIGSTISVMKLRAVPGDVVSNSSLRLINPDSHAKRFIIGIRETKQKNSYIPLKELSWIKISPETVYVAADSRSEPIKISIIVPDEPKYYNKRLICDVDISQFGAGALSTGLIVPLFIDTEASRTLPKNCDGCNLVVYPHKLSIIGSIDSLTIANWGQDTAKVFVGWNGIEQQNWREALMLMENIMGGLVPVPDTMTILPGVKKRVFIKPIAYPGRGKLYFSNVDKKFYYIELDWREY